MGDIERESLTGKGFDICNEMGFGFPLILGHFQ